MAMTALWVVIGVSVAAVVAARAWWWRRPPTESSCGTVSDQWLAEQRRDRPDSQR